MKNELVQSLKTHTYESLENLDLSQGDYEGIDLRYAVVSGSDFSNSIMKDCILIGTKFNNSNLNNVE